MVIEMVNQNVNPYHSKELRQYFNISNNGVDYYNPFNIGIEFKECFSNSKYPNIKIGNNQFNESDLLVVCFKHKEFYIHDLSYLRQRYTSNNKYNLTVIRLNSLRKDYLAKFNNYDDLKDYLNKIKNI